MEIASACPYCGINRVNAALKIWIARGYILVFKHGEKYIVGCKDCVRNAAISEFTQNLLFGWWCIPWGATTPLVLIQNLFVILTSPRDSTLREVVTLAGLNFDDLVVDSNGTCLDERIFHDNIFTVLADAIWADGRLDERELETASKIAYELLNHGISLAEIRQRLRKQYGSLQVSVLSWEQRLILYRAVIAVISADNEIHQRELEYLKQLGLLFGFSLEFINGIIDSLKADATNADEERNKAAKILCIKPYAPLDEIKSAYRQQALRYHPDRVKDEAKAKHAHEMMCEVNWAYDVLVKGTVERAYQHSYS